MSSRPTRPRQHLLPSPLTGALLLGGALLALAGCGSSGSSSTATSAASAASTSASTAAPAPTTAQGATASGGAASGGAGAGGAGAGAASTLAVAANPEGQLKFEESALSAKAGKVTIDFANMSSLGHNLTVESSAGKLEGATPTFQGASKSLTLNLEPGTYKFFCSVPGHRMAGMEGTLTVR